MNVAIGGDLYISVNNMAMEGIEKPKPKLLDAVLPSVWFIKLRSLRRKPRSLKGLHSNEPVIPDSAPFLPKTVENCYKHGVAMTSEMCIFTPLKGPHTVTINDQTFGSPSPDKLVPNAFPVSSTPGRKSSVQDDLTPKSTPATSIASTTTSTATIFSRCTYRSTLFSSLKNLCKLVGDDPQSTKGTSQMQFRKSSTPSIRAWFLAGCGSIPRPRTRHGSLDLEKESGLIELDANTGLECIHEGVGVKASWPKKAESWSGGNLTSWSVELTNDEVVKNQVVVNKKIYREPKGVKVSKNAYESPSKSKLGTKPTLAHLFSARSETDSPRKILQETEYDSSEIHIEDPKLVTLPWRSTSFGSDSTWRAPSVASELGFAAPEKKPFSLLDSETLVTYNEDFDNGNISDSQSLLRAKVLAAERLREGSKSWREHRKTDKRKDEDASKLLASLDEALDQRDLKRLIEDEEDSDQGYNSRSPRFELHNSPVFESFLESSAKAWGIDFPSLKIDDAKTSGSISDKSRELHCITVQTATQMEKAREQAHERDMKGRDTTRAVRMNNSSPAKARKAKRFVEKEVSKRRSPSRKSVPKDPREERTIHPQREESMVDPELHDEFNHARRKFNEERKRTKQRRSKQVASVPDSSPPASVPKQHAGVVKDRVAVVVESSYDPYNDFRESMIEMIVDQDIQETGDLEELLQCYLSLNEAEYHNVIVDVFTDVWHELFQGKT